ncbi:MAG: hypothetical protein JXR86_15245 [Spirochaetales bacterium]|nr:hypothetical protein [Spirochaetales bacterium]
MKASVAVKEQRSRDFSAIAIALLIHLLVVGAYLISDLLFFEDMVDYSGPVLIKLGRADAPETLTDSLPAAPVETVEEPDATATQPVEAAEERKTGTVEETVKPEEKESETAREIPVAEKEAGDDGRAEKSSESRSGESGPAVAEAPPAEVEKVVDVSKGEEEGNSFETTFESSPGIVGRSLGAPIYFYLPLPQTIGQSVFDSLRDDPVLQTRTAEKKKGILNLYYESNMGKYLLKNQKQPPIEVRPELWAILAEGGYDILNYKNDDYYLKGREITFTFVVQVGKDSTELSNVKFIRRSGYSEIDEAVVYGFKQASFYNSSDIPVKGRFTYRFE